MDTFLTLVKRIQHLLIHCVFYVCRDAGYRVANKEFFARWGRNWGRLDVCRSVFGKDLTVEYEEEYIALRFIGCL